MEDEMKNSIGQNIKRLRKAFNYTQEELAERINVTAQAISKWENEMGMPDISQLIPLATVFGVSTDTILGMESIDGKNEALRILEQAEAVKKYGQKETYLAAYDIILSGLKSYPNNMILLNNCMGLGLSLALPENGWLYVAERAAEITTETIRQAKLIISYSKDITEMLRAHQALLLLNCSMEKFDEAAKQASSFPELPSFTFYSNMAFIHEAMKNQNQESICLCTEIDYTLQHLEDMAIRLGNSYYHAGAYDEAIAIYETFFTIMKAIFKEDLFPNYHDFDSGDGYIMLARAYLAIKDDNKAMDNVEKSINYYLSLSERTKSNIIDFRSSLITPFVKNSALTLCFDKSLLKQKLLEKLSAESLQPLQNNERYKCLVKKVQEFSF